MSELTNFSEWVADRDEFLSETELEFQNWAGEIGNRIEEALTNERLRRTCAVDFSDEDMAEIRSITREFAVSHWFFHATKDAKSFNSRIEEIEDSSRTLLELLDPPIEDKCSIHVLDVLWPNPADGEKYQELKTLLTTLLDRSSAVKQAVRMGKRYGPELDSHISQLRSVWVKAGGKGHGAYNHYIKGKDRGDLLSLVRVTFDSARTILIELSERELRFLPVSDSTLTKAIKKIGKTKG